jgi:hypothetical protein
MANIQTYSPRKVTDQNRDLLPSDHDPAKRKTYVQITLTEPEIKEAIRNYIRAQVPVIDGDELPVKITAGRGENGHSAEITVQAGQYAVASPARPTVPMATFEAVAEDAARRNEESPEDASDNEFDEVQEEADSSIDKAEKVLTSLTADTKAEAPAKPPRKSSLFDAATPKSTEAAQAAVAAAPPPQTEHVDAKDEDDSCGEDAPAVEEVAASAPVRKAKSIFDT